jgi:hypothetical protein
MAILTATSIVFGDSSAINSFYGIIPKNTTVVFYQANAPTGWAKTTSQDNKALRVVSSTGGATGGNVPFTSAFPSVSNVSIAATTVGVGTVGDTTLTISQIAPHAHGSGGANTGIAAGPATPSRYLERTPIQYGIRVAYAQVRNYQQPQAYRQPQTYSQPQSFRQPQAYRQPKTYQQPLTYQQPSTYRQPSVYTVPIVNRQPTQTQQPYRTPVIRNYRQPFTSPVNAGVPVQQPRSYPFTRNYQSPFTSPINTQSTVVINRQAPFGNRGRNVFGERDRNNNARRGRIIRPNRNRVVRNYAQPRSYSFPQPRSYQQPRRSPISRSLQNNTRANVQQPRSYQQPRRNPIAVGYRQPRTTPVVARNPLTYQQPRNLRSPAPKRTPIVNRSPIVNRVIANKRVIANTYIQASKRIVANKNVPLVNYNPVRYPQLVNARYATRILVPGGQIRTANTNGPDTGLTGGDGSHNHPYTGGLISISSSVDLRVQYIDVILCYLQ